MPRSQSALQPAPTLLNLDLIRQEQARRKLLNFTQFTYPDYTANWHHKLMCRYLDEFAAGKIKRLMVFLGPRMGKSELVSRRLPAYLLGRNPDMSIIACSYSQALAGRMNRDVQRIIDSESYQKIYPDTKLFGESSRSSDSNRYLRNSEIFEIVGRRGYYRSAGVLGSITGMGMHCFPAGTLVATKRGVVAIEELCKLRVEPLPRISSFNPRTKRLEWQRIVATATKPGKPLIEISFISGRKLRCTTDHRIYTHIPTSKCDGYVSAADLECGDLTVQLHDGYVYWDAVQSTNAVNEMPEFVYDLQIGGNENFFANGTLVHNCGIIDDIFKSRAEAASEVQRENVWEWYASTFYTRLEKDGQILLTLTRWHEDDLAGKLLQLAKQDASADQWVVVSIPSECDEKARDDPREIGEYLWPAKFPAEEMLKIKATLGSYEWSAMHQQRPAPAIGGIFKRDWWRYYTELPRMDEVIQSWDLAFKDTTSSAYVVGQVWGRKDANKYLIDQHREKLSFLATIDAIRKMTAKYPQAVKKLVEDKANGPAVIDTLKNEIVGLIAVDPEGGKEARAFAVSAQIESSNVYLPDKSIASWIDVFVDEASSFPSGRFKDQIDAATQALRYLEKNAGRIYSLDIDLNFGRRESPWNA